MSKKAVYVAILIFPSYKSDGIFALLTQKQAAGIAAWLDSETEKGPLVDYYLGPPPTPQQLHVQFLTEAGLRAQLKDLIELGGRSDLGITK